MKCLYDGAFALLFIIGTAHAVAPSDADTTLICAVVDLASCAPDYGCERETSTTINAPQLIQIDRRSQESTGKRPNGELLSTRIDRASRQQDQVVLNGVQNGLSWTVTVSNESGRMSLAAIGDGVAFTAFGSCAAKE